MLLAAILLVLLYLLIFAFSGQDGEKSGSLSSMISEKCAELLNAISGKHWTQNVIDSMAAYFEHQSVNWLISPVCMHGSAAVRCVETLEGEEPETVSADQYSGCLSPPERTSSISYLSQDAMGVLRMWCWIPVAVRLDCSYVSVLRK